MQTEDEAAEEAGRINFRAYCDAVNNTNIADNPIPDWDELGDRVREGWRRGAMAVGFHVTGEIIASFAESDAQAEQIKARYRQAPKNG